MLAPFGAQGGRGRHTPHATQLFELRAVGLLHFVPSGDVLAYGQITSQSLHFVLAVDVLGYGQITSQSLRPHRDSGYGQITSQSLHFLVIPIPLKN